MPLLGITGITEYYTIRGPHQYGEMQQISQGLKNEEVRINFTIGSRKHEEHVGLTQAMWERCRPIKLRLPKGNLKGKTKTYHAS